MIPLSKSFNKSITFNRSSISLIFLLPSMDFVRSPNGTGRFTPNWLGYSPTSPQYAQTDTPTYDPRSVYVRGIKRARSTCYVPSTPQCVPPSPQFVPPSPQYVQSSPQCVPPSPLYSISSPCDDPTVLSRGNKCARFTHARRTHAPQSLDSAIETSRRVCVEFNPGYDCPYKVVASYRSRLEDCTDVVAGLEADIANTKILRDQLLLTEDMLYQLNDPKRFMVTYAIKMQRRKIDYLQSELLITNFQRDGYRRAIEMLCEDPWV